MRKRVIIQFISFLSIFLLFVSFFALSLADNPWSGPTQNPPEGNVPPPINTSIVAQAKEGALIVGANPAMSATTSLLVLNGRLGIGGLASSSLHIIGTASTPPLKIEALSSLFTVPGAERFLGYKYYRKIEVSVVNFNFTDIPDGTQIRLYPINLTRLIESEQLRSDCNDIRFYDPEFGELPYWIEPPCNTPSGTIWVRLRRFNSERKTIYMFHGNPNETASKSNYTLTLDPGLWAEYYTYTGDYNNFANWTLRGECLDSEINHPWDYNTIDLENCVTPGSYYDYVGIIWQGWVIPYGLGGLPFTVLSDDGVRVYIGPNSWHEDPTDKVFDLWYSPRGDHLTTTYKEFSNTGPHRIKIRWFEATRDAKIQLTNGESINSPYLLSTTNSNIYTIKFKYFGHLSVISENSSTLVSSSYFPALYIDETGKIGIGTTAMAQDSLLTIGGNAVVQGRMSIGSNELAPTGSILNINGNLSVTGNVSVAGKVSVSGAILVYRQSAGCASAGMLTLNSQCTTIFCSGGAPPNYYNCYGNCGSSHSLTCDNSPIGYLLPP